MIEFDIMKKLVLLVFLTLIYATPAEVTAKTHAPQREPEHYEEIVFEPQNIENDLISDEKNKEDGAIDLKIEKLDVRSEKPKFSNIFSGNGFEIKKGIIKNIEIGGHFRAFNNFTVERNEDLSSIFKFDVIQPYLNLRFSDDKTGLKASYNVARDLDYDGNFTEKISDLYIEHEFNKNQKVRIGQSRLPIGHEGSIGNMALPFFSRSMAARTYANARSVGVSNIADYKYGGYDIGIYDGSRYMQSFFQGGEFAGKVCVKPFEKIKDKAGSLTLGTSIDTGNTDNSYTVFSGFLLYNYKKLSLNLEYIGADGYSGVYTSNNRGHGFTTTISYFVTPKTEILGRYDYFKNATKAGIAQEYSAGINYHLLPQTAMSVNYVARFDDNLPTASQKIMVGLQFSTTEIFDYLSERL
mgnify:FL=1